MAAPLSQGGRSGPIRTVRERALFGTERARGLIRIARRAGIQQAQRPTPIKITATPAIVRGSVAVKPYSCAATRWPTVSAQTIPAARPPQTGVIPCRITIAASDDARARARDV